MLKKYNDFVFGVRKIFKLFGKSVLTIFALCCSLCAHSEKSNLDGVVLPFSDLRGVTQVSAEEYKKQIEVYFNGINSLGGKFSQTIVFIPKKNKDSLAVSSTKNGKKDKRRIDNIERQIFEEKGSFFLQKDSENDYKIAIVFEKNKTKQFILNNTIMSVAANGEISKIAASSTPIANIFSNKLNIEKHFPYYQIFIVPEQNILFIKLARQRNDSMQITIFFKLYQKTKNVRNLLGWMVKDYAGNITFVKFEEETIVANDTKSFPANVFEVYDNRKKKRRVKQKNTVLVN